jgi:hypothetical protein
MSSGTKYLCSERSHFSQRTSGLTTFSTLGGSDDVFVAETTVEKGLELLQTASRNLIVEPNSHLIHLETTSQVKFSAAQPDLPPPVAAGVPIQIQPRDVPRLKVSLPVTVWVFRSLLSKNRHVRNETPPDSEGKHAALAFCNAG